MQARLPDINTAIIRYRNHAIYSFTARDNLGCIIALKALNALMPEDYKIELDTKKYEQIVAEKKFLVCCKCSKEIQYDQKLIFPVILTHMDSVVMGSRSAEMWVCPECQADNYLKYTRIKNVSLQEPFYTGVVRQAPKKAFGIIGRTTYQPEFDKWFEDTLEEIEAKIGKYRTDYAAQQDDGYEIPEEKHDEV